MAQLQVQTRGDNKIIDDLFVATAVNTEVFKTELSLLDNDDPEEREEYFEIKEAVGAVLKMDQIPEENRIIYIAVPIVVFFIVFFLCICCIEKCRNKKKEEIVLLLTDIPCTFCNRST